MMPGARRDRDAAQDRRTPRLRPAAIAALAALVLIMPPAAPHAGDVIGHVLFASGAPTITGANQASRPASRGEVLRLGELVSTSAGETAQIKLRQGSLVQLRAATEITFESGGGVDSARVLRMQRGSVRMINREIGQWQTLAIKTAFALLLVGDTDCEVIVIPPPADGAAAASAGTYAFANAGTATLRTPHGSLVIVPGTFAFAAAAEVPPALIPLLPPEVETIVLGGAGNGQ
jgi:hypothetical protein